MPISEMAIRKALPKDKDYKLGDSGGLYALVRPNGTRLWRLDYRFAGKRKTLALGAYPEVALADARAKRDAARKLVAEGVDPSVEKKTQRTAAATAAGNTFLSVVKEHIERLEHDGAAEKTMQRAKNLLENLAYPLHQRPIGEIKPVEVLELLQSVEKTGKLETANRLRTAISAVFRLAVVTLRADSDPTFSLRGATKSPKVKNRAALLDPKKLGWLMREIDVYDGWPTLRCAMAFAALTAARPGEVRCAEWQEIDLKAARWLIPAQRTKMRRPHEVPLSKQAVAVLEDIAKLTGRDKLVFSSIRTNARPLSENSLNSGLRRIGLAKEEHTAHGFRSSFSTLLNERGEDAEIIELCLAHVDGNKVRKVYNRALRIEERARMMQLWADMLDDFRRL